VRIGAMAADQGAAAAIRSRAPGKATVVGTAPAGSNGSAAGKGAGDGVLRIFGVPVKWMALVALTFQTTWQVLVLKIARAGGTPYLNSVVILCSELLKMVLSFVFLCVEQGGVAAAVRIVQESCSSGLVQNLRLSVPAIAYALQNNLIFLSLEKLSMAVQQVTYQLKILTAAALMRVMLGKQLTATKWLSLLLLVVGVSLVQWPKELTPSGSSGPTGHLFDRDSAIGFMAVLTACFCSGLAGVYIEMILKGSRSIWLRNAQLGFFGSLAALLGVLVQDGDVVRQGGFTQGFSARVFLAIFTTATGGLLVAVVLKYADNILRQFSTAISIIITSLISTALLQDFAPDVTFVVGTTLTIVATFMYNLGLPAWLLR
jgi:UDP-sugar transporter A1/2/3